jgi:hypothetical protein
MTWKILIDPLIDADGRRIEGTDNASLRRTGRGRLSFVGQGILDLDAQRRLFLFNVDSSCCRDPPPRLIGRIWLDVTLLNRLSIYESPQRVTPLL